MFKLTMAATCLFVANVSALAAGLNPIIDAEDRLEPAAPAIVDGLAAKSAATRSAAAIALGRIQQPACVDPLLARLSDRSAAVRAEALFSLGQLAWDPSFTDGRESEIATAVANHLGEKRLGVRLAAIEAIGKIGLERAPDLLNGLLQDRSASVRAETLLALFRYRYVLETRGQKPPALPQAVVDQFPALAADRSVAVRRALAYNFVVYKDVRGLSLEIGLASDKDEWTRFFALRALRKIADPAAATTLEASLADTSAVVRHAAVQTAAAIGKADLLEGCVEDAATHVRSAVAEALGTAAGVSEDTAAGWLRQLAADPSGEVRAAALGGLAARLRTGAAQDLLAAMGDANEYVRAAAVMAAAALSPEERDSIAAMALAESSVAVQSAVLTLLSTDTSEAAFAVVQEKLADPRVDVRGAAIAALASRKEAAALGLGWDAYLANLDAHFNFLRKADINVMAAFDNDASDSHLREMLADPAYPVAMAARDTLLGRDFKDVPTPSDHLTFSPYRDLHVPRHPVVTLETTRGVIKIKCCRDQAPIHVANFVGLVRQGFFDGKTWQRVVPNFVIQGGSPSTLGWESQTFMLRAEVNRFRFGRGAVGMSRDDLFNTGDSQLFIANVLAPHLDGLYTYFGQVVKGFDALDGIEAGDIIIKASVR